MSKRRREISERIMRDVKSFQMNVVGSDGREVRRIINVIIRKIESAEFRQMFDGGR